MSTIREIDPQAVEAAEYLRRTGHVEEAALAASEALGYNSRELTQEEIAEIALRPRDRAVLACLARIHVDSEKSIGNQNLDPSKRISRLEECAKTICLVYRNEELRRNLKTVSKDHLGREHYFLAEMIRDEVKVVEAASVLYPRGEAAELITHAIQTLAWESAALMSGHPTQPLMDVEVELMKARHSVGQIDEQRLLESALKVAEVSQDPQRVATVMAWLVVWGRRIGNPAMIGYGESILDQKIKEHPEFKKDHLIADEEGKIAKLKKGRLWFSIWTPLMVSNKRLTDLWNQLTPSLTISE